MPSFEEVLSSLEVVAVVDSVVGAPVAVAEVEDLTSTGCRHSWVVH